MKSVVFMGGKVPGYMCLQHLLAHPGFEVKAVISNWSDLDEGPGRWYPRMGDLVGHNEVPLYHTDKANKDCLGLMRRVRPDYLIVVFYDQILKPRFYGLAGTALNLHMADAERYRGCYPNIFALRNGESEYGVTLHRIDQGTDTGPVVACERFELSPHWMGHDLYFEAAERAAGLLAANLDALAVGPPGVTPQRAASDCRFYRRKDFPGQEVVFEGSAQDVRNQIRSMWFPPFPRPWFRIGDRRFEIVEVEDGMG